jgi:hypothetical protein
VAGKHVVASVQSSSVSAILSLSKATTANGGVDVQEAQNNESTNRNQTQAALSSERLMLHSWMPSDHRNPHLGAGK